MGRRGSMRTNGLGNRFHHQFKGICPGLGVGKKEEKGGRGRRSGQGRKENKTSEDN